MMLAIQPHLEVPMVCATQHRSAMLLVELLLVAVPVVLGSAVLSMATVVVPPP